MVLAQHGTLLRGALAALLDQEEEIQVVAQSADGDEGIHTAVRRHSPHVAVLDSDLLGRDGASRLDELCRTIHDCSFLVMVDEIQCSFVGCVCQRQPSRVGFVAKDCVPSRFVEAIHRTAGGEQFVDPALAVAALRSPADPLTAREKEMLALVADGMPVKEIASQTFLAPGTVRNYLSHAIFKTGGRTRIEAIRIAQDAGWL